MPRIPRMVIEDEPAVYHVMSHTALDGYVLGDIEKDYLVRLIQQLSRIYFTETLGYSVMGNHFHLCPRMLPADEFNDEEIRRRFEWYYHDMLGDKKRQLTKGQIPGYRMKWAKLSEYIKEIKERFSRYYNRLHGRRGHFWGGRFKSVIVEEGDTLLNLLAYIDLNPVRAGLVQKPEDYRWCSLGYHIQTNNRGRFLSLDFGLAEFEQTASKGRLKRYREYVYSQGGIISELPKGDIVPADAIPDLKTIDLFRYRTRYFTDSGIIGSKAFVIKHYKRFKHHFYSSCDKKPKPVKGLAGVYSLKRLPENIS